MGNVVVDVMLKPEILDPQGQAVAGALPRLGLRPVHRRPPGQALRAHRRRRGHRRASRRRPRGGRDAAVQPGDRGRRLGAPGARRDRVKVGVVTFPGSLDDRDAARAVRSPAAPRRSPLWHGDADLHGVDAVVLPGGFSYGDYLRCGAIARFAPVMDALVPAAQRRPAGPRHLQRLPGPLRVAPAARRADPQRPPQVHLHRPAAARRERLDRLDLRLRGRGQEITIVLKNGEGGFVADERDAGRARGRGPGRLPLRRRQPQRLLPRHRGHHQRARQRRRPDAAPRARGRGRLRPARTDGLGRSSPPS